MIEDLLVGVLCDERCSHIRPFLEKCCCGGGVVLCRASRRVCECEGIDSGGGECSGYQNGLLTRFMITLSNSSDLDSPMRTQ